MAVSVTSLSKPLTTVFALERLLVVMDPKMIAHVADLGKGQRAMVT